MNTTRPDIDLGNEVRDTITDFRGIAVAITNWLAGCQRVTVQPRGLHDGKPIESITFDAEQLEVLGPGLVSTIKAARPVPTGGPSIAPTRAPDPGVTR